MCNFFRRCKAKKGFTMVELIIVIAIIGVLLAMILPNMLMSDTPTKAKGYAKSYYYTVQDFMSRQRIADDPSNPALDSTTGNFYFYTTVNAAGMVVESGIIPSGSTFDGTMTNSTAFQGGSDPQALKNLVTKFATSMENNLTASEYAGTFYAVVDSNYIVQAAYWSEGLMSQLSAGNSSLAFEDDGIINGYVTCSYPVYLCEVSGVSDRSMFKYTY